MNTHYEVIPDVSEEQNKKWPQYLASLSALMAIICSGIDFGWPSPSLPKILSDEYPFNVTTEEASYIAIIGPFGDIIGSIASHIAMDLFGRKWTIILIGLHQVASNLMIYTSFYSKILLYTARFAGGIAKGACYTVLLTYVCEVTEPEIRGGLGACFFLGLNLGILFINIVGTYLSIHNAALISLCVNAIFLVMFVPMPESPYYLLMKSKVEAARSSLKKLRSRKNVEEELSTLIEAVQRQMSENGGFRDLVTIESNRMALVAMGMMRVLQPGSGFSAFMYYGQLLAKQATNTVPAQYVVILMVSFQIVFGIIAIMIVDKVGRKPLLLLSIAGCFLALIINGVFFTIRDTSVLDVSQLGLLPLLDLLFFIALYALGLGTVVNLMSGELFPQRVKAKAVCATTVIYSFTTLVSVKFYQYTADNYSLSVPFFAFAGICCVGFVVCKRFVPETTNKTLEEIQLDLKQKV